jgi:hypothetical protein
MTDTRPRVLIRGLLPTRMEHSTLEGGYYSIDDFPLRDGLRAAIGEEDLNADHHLGSTDLVQAGCCHLL